MFKANTNAFTVFRLPVCFYNGSRPCCTQGPSINNVTTCVRVGGHGERGGGMPISSFRCLLFDYLFFCSISECSVTLNNATMTKKVFEDRALWYQIWSGVWLFVTMSHSINNVHASQLLHPTAVRSKHGSQSNMGVHGSLTTNQTWGWCPWCQSSTVTFSW